MKRRPLIFGTAVAAAAVLALAGCASNPGSDGDADKPASGADAADYGLVADGTLTVCSDIPYPPFEFEGGDNGTGYTGFDIDLLDAGKTAKLLLLRIVVAVVILKARDVRVPHRIKIRD